MALSYSNVLGNGSGCSVDCYIVLVTVEPFDWRATNPTRPKECKYAYAEWTESAAGRCLRPMKTLEWTKCDDRLPPEGVAVETKIDDAKGCRNECELKRGGNLWFFTDDSMYVYYRPTHWRDISARKGAKP